jgi:hypothetical protein
MEFGVYLNARTASAKVRGPAVIDAADGIAP